MLQNYSTEEIQKSLEKLATTSETARKLLANRNTQVVDVLSNDITDFGFEFTFHPTGACGCIEMDDENFLGIRCNHLMWAEGWCERNDSYIHSYNGTENVLLIFGNHKGTFKAQAIF